MPSLNKKTPSWLPIFDLQLCTARLQNLRVCSKPCTAYGCAVRTNPTGCLLSFACKSSICLHSFALQTRRVCTQPCVQTLRVCKAYGLQNLRFCTQSLTERSSATKPADGLTKAPLLFRRLFALDEKAPYYLPRLRKAAAQKAQQDCNL